MESNYTMRFIGNLPLCFLIFTLSCFSDAAVGTTNGAICQIDAIYQFGDSISDTGNLRAPYLPSNKNPYGRTFPGQPTGRWSDGRLILDYATDFFRLPSLSLISGSSSSPNGGINFAFAGATALDVSTLAGLGINAVNVPSLSTQVGFFNESLAALCQNKADCKNKLKNSLIFFGEIGGNDINYGLLSNKTLAQMKDILPTTIDVIVQNLEAVIDSGATRFVVPGNFPIGCIPSTKSDLASDTSSLYDPFGCNIAANLLAVDQNLQLVEALAVLSIKHPDIKITYLDYYSGFKSLLLLAPINGFNKVDQTKPCCGTGDYNVFSSGFCSGEGVPVCDNPDQYINWDGIHLTQAAYAGIFNFIRPILEATACFPSL